MYVTHMMRRQYCHTISVVMRTPVPEGVRVMMVYRLTSRRRRKRACMLYRSVSHSSRLSSVRLSSVWLRAYRLRSALLWPSRLLVAFLRTEITLLLTRWLLWTGGLSRRCGLSWRCRLFWRCCLSWRCRLLRTGSGLLLALNVCRAVLCRAGIATAAAVAAGSWLSLCHRRTHRCDEYRQ